MAGWAKQNANSVIFKDCCAFFKITSTSNFLLLLNDVVLTIISHLNPDISIASANAQTIAPLCIITFESIAAENDIEHTNFTIFPSCSFSVGFLIMKYSGLLLKKAPTSTIPPPTPYSGSYLTILVAIISDNSTLIFFISFKPSIQPEIARVFASSQETLPYQSDL